MWRVRFRVSHLSRTVGTRGNGSVSELLNSCYENCNMIYLAYIWAGCAAFKVFLTREGSGRYWRRMKRVAIIGASKDRGKYGNKAVRAFLPQGYRAYRGNLSETEVRAFPACSGMCD